LGHPSKFQRLSQLAFVTAASSLTGGQQNFAQCFAVAPGLVHYIYIFGALAPDRFLPGAKFTLCLSLAFSYIGSVTARHSSSGRHASAKLSSVVQGMELRNFRRGRHLYSAGRPSRWPSPTFLFSSPFPQIDSSPYCADMWRRYCYLTSFFPIVNTCLSCEDIARQSCAMCDGVQMANFWRFFCVLHFQRVECTTF